MSNTIQFGIPSWRCGEQQQHCGQLCGPCGLREGERGQPCGLCEWGRGQNRVPRTCHVRVQSRGRRPGPPCFEALADPRHSVALTQANPVCACTRADQGFIFVIRCRNGCSWDKGMGGCERDRIATLRGCWRWSAAALRAWRRRQWRERRICRSPWWIAH